MGFLEALMLNDKGEIAECTGDNVFIIRKDILYTPPLDAGSLRGITRAAVMDIANNIELWSKSRLSRGMICGLQTNVF